MTFGTDGKTLYGHTPAEAVRKLKHAGAAVVGINCGVGPQPTLEVLEQILAAADGTPVSAMPNAGLPQRLEGRFVYSAGAEYFGQVTQRMVDAGARIAFGTDWYVEPLNPMLGLYAAVTRQFPDGTPPGGWHPEERLTMTQAIEFYTLGSAYAEFAEARKGSITEGKLADFVVLSRDLFSVPPREVLETRPVVTVVGGRIVYEAASGATSPGGHR